MPRLTNNGPVGKVRVHDAIDHCSPRMAAAAFHCPQLAGFNQRAHLFKPHRQPAPCVVVMRRDALLFTRQAKVF